MNELYAEFKDQAGDLLTTIVVKLSLPDPFDLTDIDLSEYKGHRHRSTREVVARSRAMVHARPGDCVLSTRDEPMPRESSA